MKAMVIKSICDVTSNPRPLSLVELPVPEPDDHQVLVKVKACGVCHTELDEIEGRAPPPKLPVVAGHQVVGTVAAAGAKCQNLKVGERAGVAWIYSACGRCPFCRSGQENLCAEFTATGRDVDGGYAEYIAVSEQFAHRLPEQFSDAQAAPLLCAGAIGYRSLRLSGIEDGQALGLTGFGASAHLVLKMVRSRYPRTPVFVFARSERERHFAMKIGAIWAGPQEQAPPQKLNAIIDTTPAWRPVLEGLRHLERGGRLVINAIRKEAGDQRALLSLDYSEHLWLEKEIKSVANVTRRDVSEFLELAAAIPLEPEVQTYALEEANMALWELKNRQIRGAKVLLMD